MAPGGDSYGDVAGEITGQGAGVEEAFSEWVDAYTRQEPIPTFYDQLRTAFMAGLELGARQVIEQVAKHEIRMLPPGPKNPRVIGALAPPKVTVSLECGHGGWIYNDETCEVAWCGKCRYLRKFTLASDGADDP